MKKLKLPKIGTAFEGGFFAGRFFIGADTYALIVAPKGEGQIDPMPWNGSHKNIAGATSYCDGLTNTKAMAKAGSALAKRILELKIGDFTDWYLPSRLELMLAYYELKGVKNFAKEKSEAFDIAWYWSSTRHAEYADYAWDQSFGYGRQTYWSKGDFNCARAVRRIKI